MIIEKYFLSSVGVSKTPNPGLLPSHWGCTNQSIPNCRSQAQTKYTDHQISMGVTLFDSEMETDEFDHYGEQPKEEY